MEQDEKDFFDFMLGYRKTVAWFSLFGIAILFRLKGYVNGDQFVDLTKATFLGFITGNLGEHLGNLGKAYFNSKGSVPAVLSSVKAAIEKKDNS